MEHLKESKKLFLQQSLFWSWLVGMVSLVIVSFNHLITKGTANTPVLILLSMLFAQQGIYQFKLDRATGGQKGVWQFTKIVLILSIIFSLTILLSY